MTLATSDASEIDSMEVHPATQARDGEMDKDGRESSGNSDEEEAPSSSQQLWPVKEIIGERKNQYFLRWDGIDPRTGEEWKPTWENKNNATAILIKEWNELKKSKRRKSKGKGKKAATASASPAGQTRVARPPTSNPVKPSIALAVPKSTSTSTKAKRSLPLPPPTAATASSLPSKKRRATHSPLPSAPIAGPAPKAKVVDFAFDFAVDDDEDQEAEVVARRGSSKRRRVVEDSEQEEEAEAEDEAEPAASSIETQIVPDSQVPSEGLGLISAIGELGSQEEQEGDDDMVDETFEERSIPTIPDPGPNTVPRHLRSAQNAEDREAPSEDEDESSLQAPAQVLPSSSRVNELKALDMDEDEDETQPIDNSFQQPSQPASVPSHGLSSPPLSDNGRLSPAPAPAALNLAHDSDDSDDEPIVPRPRQPAPLAARAKSLAPIRVPHPSAFRVARDSSQLTDPIEDPDSPLPSQQRSSSWINSTAARLARKVAEAFALQQQQASSAPRPRARPSLHLSPVHPTSSSPAVSVSHSRSGSLQPHSSQPVVLKHKFHQQPTAGPFAPRSSAGPSTAIKRPILRPPTPGPEADAFGEGGVVARPMAFHSQVEDGFEGEFPELEADFEGPGSSAKFGDEDGFEWPGAFEQVEPSRGKKGEEAVDAEGAGDGQGQGQGRSEDRGRQAGADPAPNGVPAYGTFGQQNGGAASNGNGNGARWEGNGSGGGGQHGGGGSNTPNGFAFTSRPPSPAHAPIKRDFDSLAPEAVAAVAAAKKPRTDTPPPHPSSTYLDPSLAAGSRTPARQRSTSPNGAGTPSSRNASPGPINREMVRETLLSLIRDSVQLDATDATKDELTKYVTDPAAYIATNDGPLSRRPFWVFGLRPAPGGDKTDLIIVNSTEGTFQLKRALTTMLPGFDVATSISHSSSRTAQAAPQSPAPALAPSPAPVAAPKPVKVIAPAKSAVVEQPIAVAPPVVELPSVASLSREHLEQEVTSLRLLLKQRDEELSTARPLAAEASKLRVDVATLTRNNKNLSSSKESAAADFNYLQRQYSEASNAAVARAQEAVVAEAEAARLKKVLDVGMAQRDLFQKGESSKLKEHVERLKLEVGLLKSERRRTDAGVREKAALWDTHVAEETERELSARERGPTSSPGDEPSVAASYEVFQCAWRETPSQPCDAVLSTRKDLLEHAIKEHVAPPVSKLVSSA